MKKIIPMLAITWVVLTGTAGNISPERLRSAATSFMNAHRSEAQFLSQQSIAFKENETVGYLFHFLPTGFMIISAWEDVAPVYAFSLEAGFDPPADVAASLKAIIAKDLRTRIDAAGGLPEPAREAIRLKWQTFLNRSSWSPLFERWPPEGTTSTGGWLETNWTQSFPYNKMCPMDLNAGTRSVAGCPATAMAQILNHHREINQTRFTSGDDYYHNYGSGNSYWIDDDYLARGFPCYDTLNLWLDTLESVYLAAGNLSDNLKAALTFACGVAAKQVYTASVSGTFGLGQAIMAFQRFGFADSRLVFPQDTTLNALIAGNVKVALPVQLGLLVAAGSGGHNVVVDGYNTDEFYHFNFGWGGSANGWYTLPPTNIPYNLTIVEGAVLDIKSPLYTAVPRSPGVAYPVKVYPNPWKDKLFIDGLDGPSTLIVFNLLYEPVFSCVIPAYGNAVSTENIPQGCYIYRIISDRGMVVTGKLFRQ